MSINNIKNRLFYSLDFGAIPANKDFKEADVRAVVIDPILKELGFTHETILREKALQSPFLRTGSTRRPVNLIPDYILKVGNACAWVLDAKAPNQKIVNDDNVEQVYSYAAHPEIRSKFFALCNGIEFACYRSDGYETPALYFHVEEIDDYWDALKRLLSPDSFQTGKTYEYEKPTEHKKEFDYKNRPLLKEIPLKRQAARRHFGVHPYFTKQSWNVVSKYIENYTRTGDVVLDPFGGSGVTAIEALMSKRKAINIDINPLAVFLVDALAAPVNEFQLREAFEKIKKEFTENEPKTKKEIQETLEKYPGPKALPLPKGSDVKTVPELFSKKQLAQLSLLKGIIKKNYGKKKDNAIYKTLMLMFSGIVTRNNATYFLNSHRGGNAAAMWIYRYRISPNPTELDFQTILNLRFKAVLAAKKEMSAFINEETIKNAQIQKGSATDLSFIEDESIDYIYTDPPYGKNIPYLDLSTMWNAWLDLDVSQKDYELEAIEDGSLDKSKEEYKKLIAKSIEEMYRVLKFDRWLSFVFAHKDPEFWHLIVDTCEKCGFEYKGAVAQKNGSSNYHERQNPFTVLSGELIINFCKVRSPRAILKANIGMNMSEIVMQTIEGIIAKNEGATHNEINNELITKGLELGFLDLLAEEYKNIIHILQERFEYDANTRKYYIINSFTSHLDVRVRIEYYLTAFLRRKELSLEFPTFSEIILHIMPRLKNGVTPEQQTILSVLEDIAERVGDDRWKLKPKENGLFD